MKVKRLVTDVRQQFEMMTSPVVGSMAWFWGWFRFLAVIGFLSVFVLLILFAALSGLAAVLTLVTLEFEAAKFSLFQMAKLIGLAAALVVPLYALGYRFPGVLKDKMRQMPEMPDSIAAEISEYRNELARDHAVEDARLERKEASEGLVTLVEDIGDGGELSPAGEDGELSLADKSSTKSSR